MWWIFIIGLLIIAIVWSLKPSNEYLNLHGKSVFISGCDTGFGNGLALRLDRLGLKVFAGCLTANGARTLRSQASSQLEAIVCDITKAEDIENVVKTVESASPDGVWAVVNNAGIGGGGEWDWFQEKLFRQIMEINFFGHVAVTRAFLPLLKRGKGRVVNLASVAGFAAPHGMGAYSASKFAMEAFSDTLRREMRKWGIKVYVIEPGFTSTPMMTGIDATLKKMWDVAPEEIRKEYGEAYAQKVVSPKIPFMDPPELVLDVLESKVMSKNPTLRSRVGKLANITYVLTTFLPTSWVDVILELLNPPAIPEVLLKKDK